VKLVTENAHQHPAYKNECQEPLQSPDGRVIAIGDPYTFISDLGHVAELLPGRGLRFVPGKVLAAIFFRQQVKMKLQLFVYFAVNAPAVETSKWSDQEIHFSSFNYS